MTTEELRAELERLAAGAPEVDVPVDTWSRARRARRRDLGLGVLAGAAAVALVVGLVAWLPDRGDVDPAGSGDAGVPATVHAVPTGALEPTSELAVGRAAVAMVSGDLPVVVDADDGAYTALELPGFGPLQRDQGVLSLSPDGRRLAWAWSESDGGRTRTGIRVLSLESGRIRSVPSSEPIFVYDFAWSPDSRWLVWDGTLARWSSNGFTAGDAAAGRIGPDGDGMTRIPRSDEESTRLAVGDDGTVLVATRGAEKRFSLVGSGTKPRPDGWYPALLSETSGVRLESVDRNSADNVLERHYRGIHNDAPVPAPALRGLRLRQLGWVDGRAVALVGPADGTTTNVALIEIGDPVSVREVGEVRGDARGVSVAVDLMTLDRPTVDRPRPEWLDEESSAGTWGLVALGVALLALVGGVAYYWRRPADGAAVRTPAGLRELVVGLVLGGLTGSGLLWTALALAERDTLSNALLVGLEVLVLAGLLLLPHRRWRWFGGGLALGAAVLPIAIYVAYVIAVGGG